MTATTRSSSTQRRADSNGSRGAAPPALAPTRPAVRLPEVAVGLLVTVTFALGAVLWHLNATSKTPVLAVASAVERGEVITIEDLRIVYVATDDHVAHIASTQSAQVVGRRALVDLAPGVLVVPSVIAEVDALQVGDGVVGLALDPGQYPALGIAPGDRVNVVVADSTTATSGPAESVIARSAVVFAVTELTSDRKLVSLRAAELDAEAVAAAAAPGSLRLVQVAS